MHTVRIRYVTGRIYETGLLSLHSATLLAARVLCNPLVVSLIVR